MFRFQQRSTPSIVSLGFLPSIRRARKLTGYLFAALVVASAGRAQLGDGAESGEAQKSLVPDHLIPPASVRTAEEALATFSIMPGYKLEIAASDPLVQDPVAMTFGADGRLWVVEMRSFMADLDGRGETAPIGRVVVLADRDGDGRYDHSQVFVDQLVMPRAVAVVAGGVLVGAPPELAFWRDTDGDGKADQKTVVATDYGVKIDPDRPLLSNPEAAANGLLWAHDNWIYSASYTKKFRYVNGTWETKSTPYRGQWGLSQDDFGRLFFGSNSSHLRADMVFADYLTRNPNFPRLAGANVLLTDDQLLWPIRVTPGINRGYRPEMLRDGRLKTFTAACGPWIYRGDLMPELYGNSFAAEPAAHLIRRSVLKEEKGTLRGYNAYQEKEFIASTDERFRPVNFATGPDGALYLVDLYRGVLQHRIALTSYLRKQIESRGLDQPLHLGRIYRVVPSDRPAPRVTRIPELSSAEWVQRLSHPNAWWRETAQRILVERAEASSVAAIRNVAVAGTGPHGRVQALWTLEGLNKLDRETLATALRHPEPEVLVAALRLSEPFLRDGKAGDLLPQLSELARHPRADVQLQAVLSLGEARDPSVDRMVAEVVRESALSPYVRDAFYSGLAGRELTLFEALVANKRWNGDQPDATPILAKLAGGIIASRQPAAAERLFTLISAQNLAQTKRIVALLDGVNAGLGASRRPLTLAQAPAGWEKLIQVAALKGSLARLEGKIAWPGRTVKGAVAVAPLTAAQQKWFDSGKTIYAAICAGCHQVDGRGLDGVAPALLDSEWVMGSAERLARIILHGVRGPITVAGKTFTGDMPGLGGALDDEQISAVLTYVRREWEHGASAIAPDTVKAIRDQTKGQTDGWSVRELTLIK